MILRSVRLKNFRNLVEQEAEFSDSLNILVGQNGQGKTNLLEAIYFLSSTKSFRTNQVTEMANYQAREFYVHGTLLKKGLQRELTISISDKEKRLFVNAKEENILNYVGMLDVIAFTADHLNIVKGYPEERRRFLDRAIVGLHPTYLKTVSDYNRVLRQKNALLKALKEGKRKSSIDTLDVWNEELLHYGTQIVRMRHRFVNELKLHLTNTLFTEDQLKIKYLPLPNPTELDEELKEYRALFEKRLKEDRDEEIATGHALVGPHRDELLLFINGKSLQKFGSSGQKRSALYGLNLACLEIYFKSNGEYPIFLIDDIDAELDLSRIQTVLNHLIGKCQLFISTSKIETVQKFLQQGSVFDVHNGRITLTG